MNYIIRANQQFQIREAQMFKGQSRTDTFDYRPWADDFGAPTSVTATVKFGQATLSNESLSSGVKTMVITTAEEGVSLIELTATAGNNIHKLNLRVLAKDPENRIDDYGYCK